MAEPSWLQKKAMWFHQPQGSIPLLESVNDMGLSSTQPHQCLRYGLRTLLIAVTGSLRPTLRLIPFCPLRIYCGSQMLFHSAEDFLVVGCEKSVRLILIGPFRLQLVADPLCSVVTASGCGCSSFKGWQSHTVCDR